VLQAKRYGYGLRNGRRKIIHEVNGVSKVERLFKMRLSDNIHIILYIILGLLCFLYGNK